MKLLSISLCLGAALGLAMDKSAMARTKGGLDHGNTTSPHDEVPGTLAFLDEPLEAAAYSRVGHLKYTFGPEHLPLAAYDLAAADLAGPRTQRLSSSRFLSSLGVVSDDPFSRNITCHGDDSWASYHAAFLCREWLASREFDYWFVKSGSPIDLCTVQDGDANDDIILRIAASSRSTENVRVQSAAAALGVQHIIEKCGRCDGGVCHTGGTNDFTGYLDMQLHVYAPKADGQVSE